MRGPASDCPAHATTLVEHFLGADCLDCWTAAPAGPGAARTPGAGEWSLDWIVPAAGDAAMAPGALPEAAERLARLDPHLAARLATPPAAFDTATPLPRPAAGHRLRVHSSLPYQGYFGVQVRASGLWPAGSTGWVALVELLPTGTRGSTIPRRLVRVVAGPLALPAAPGAKSAVAPLHALRWPANAHPDRLMATAWIEGADGRILQLTSDRCPDRDQGL